MAKKILILFFFGTIFLFIMGGVAFWFAPQWKDILVGSATLSLFFICMPYFLILRYGSGKYKNMVMRKDTKTQD